MKRLAVIISPNYKDYASRYLVDCARSLSEQSFSDFDLFLVDNESSETSYNYLRDVVPAAHILRCEHNAGFAGGNNTALQVVIEKQYEYALLLNMDTVISKDCLEKLIMAADAHDDAAAIQARLMLWPDTKKINSLGNEMHFLGFGFCRAYQHSYSPASIAFPEIAYPSGAGVLLRVSVLRAVGLFDEEMWMYNEDQDLGWRFWLAGYRCLLAPEAVVYHKYEFSRSIQKYYWMDRNRLIAILKNYHALTLLFILPALVMMEAGLALFSLQSGWWKEKLKVWQYFLSYKHWNYIMRERRRIQSTRRIREKKIAALISGRIWYQEIDDAKLRLINPVFDAYWKILRYIMWW